MPGPSGIYVPPPGGGASPAEIAAAIALYNFVNGIGQPPQADPGGGAAINVKIGEAYDYGPTVSHATHMTWELLPPGATVNPLDTYRIEGIATEPTGFHFARFTIINATDQFETRQKLFNVQPADPPFNEFATNFNNGEWMTAPAAPDNPLYRTPGPSGTPWSVSFWFNAGIDGNKKQTVLLFGGPDKKTDGRVHIRFKGDVDSMELVYGPDDRNVTVITDPLSVVAQVWQHIVVTYDGGVTGDVDGTNPDAFYTDAFKVFIDGVQVNTTGSVKAKGGFEGWEGEIPADHYTIGRNGADNDFMRSNCGLDEVALYNVDLSTIPGFIPVIYNGGTADDLIGLAAEPLHWYRMGDDAVFPVFPDVGTGVPRDMVAMAMTAIAIVPDVPPTP